MNNTNNKLVCLLVDNARFVLLHCTCDNTVPITVTQISDDDEINISPKLLHHFTNITLLPLLLHQLSPYFSPVSSRCESDKPPYISLLLPSSPLHVPSILPPSILPSLPFRPAYSEHGRRTLRHADGVSPP